MLALKLDKSSLVTVLVYIIFLILNIYYLFYFTIYHFEFSVNPEQVKFYKYFTFPYNNDHDKIYVHVFGQLINGIDVGSLNIANGVAYFYYYLSLLIPFGKEDAVYVSFIVNNISILVGYIFFTKIKNEILNLSKKSNYVFFLNPLLIWHSQLINKDILMMSAILAGTYYLYKKKYLMILLITFLITFFRYYLGLLIPAALIALKFKNKILMIVIYYITISLITAYVYSQSDRTIFLINRAYTGKELEMGITGIASLVVHLNFNYYYTGNLLLGPIKSLAYLYDLIRCYNFFSTGKIDLHLLFHIPIVSYFLFNLKIIISFLINLNILKDTKLWIIFLVLIIYYFVILGSPLVHARYLFGIFYLLVLLIMGWKNNKFDYTKNKIY